jgi:hypothetical protein
MPRKRTRQRRTVAETLFENFVENLFTQQQRPHGFEIPKPREKPRSVFEIRRSDIETYLELIAAGKKALAMKYHPDRGGSTEAMAKVNALADGLSAYIRSVKK